MSPSESLSSLGVIKIGEADVSYEAAAEHFQQAIELAREMQGDESIWAVTWCNLGHCHRMLGYVPSPSYPSSCTNTQSPRRSSYSLHYLTIIRPDIRNSNILTSDVIPHPRKHPSRNTPISPCSCFRTSGSYGYGVVGDGIEGAD